MLGLSDLAGKKQAAAATAADTAGAVSIAKAVLAPATMQAFYPTTPTAQVISTAAPPATSSPIVKYVLYGLGVIAIGFAGWFILKRVRGR